MDVKNEFTIALIAAVGLDRAIGIKGHLPWKLSDDSEYYRNKIRGYPVIMGRKTFEEIKQPYAGVINVIVSSRLMPTVGAVICESVAEGIETIKRAGHSKMFVIGGQFIYQDGLDYATDMFITHVNANTENADTFFPEVDWNMWEEIEEERKYYSVDDRNQYDFRISHYVRKYKYLALI